MIQWRGAMNEAARYASDGQFARMSDFRKLDVWEKGHTLLLNVHSVAKKIHGADYLTLRNRKMLHGLLRKVEGRAKDQKKKKEND